MVVLSVGLNPPADVKGLANKFGIELNSHGFCKVNPVPILWRPPGPGSLSAEPSRVLPIFPSRFLPPAEPAPNVVNSLTTGEGELAKERIYPPERDVSQEEPRIGVFVCHCGANIGRIVSVPSTVEYGITLPNVVHAQEQIFSCATNSAKEITDMTKEKGLNRVVVAACSPRTLEPLFRDTLREAGINQYYLRHGQYQRTLLLGPPERKGRGHRKGKGYNPDVGSPGVPFGAFTGI